VLVQTFLTINNQVYIAEHEMGCLFHSSMITIMCKLYRV